MSEWSPWLVGMADDDDDGESEVTKSMLVAEFPGHVVTYRNSKGRGCLRTTTLVESLPIYPDFFFSEFTQRASYLFAN